MKTSRYSRDEFRKLLAAYAALAYEHAEHSGQLLQDPWMILAIQERIWTPPAPPTKG